MRYSVDYPDIRPLYVFQSNSSKCQNCVPLHYGVEGSECKACGCNPDGVSNSNLVCAEPHGNCSCKPKVIGKYIVKGMEESLIECTF